MLFAPRTRPNGRLLHSLPTSSLAALALMLAVPATAAAQDDDLLASMFTGNGLELRRDDRVFTLFAALNAAGFERAEQTRDLPFPKRLHHPLRTRIRQSLPRPDSAIVKKVDAFLDAHPLPVEAYVKAALSLGDAPGFAQGEGFPAELDGLGPLLAEFAKAAGLEKNEKANALAYRDELRRLRDAVDEPFLALRAAYRLNEEEAPVLQLVPNPLDAVTAAVAFRTPDDFHIVVLGAPRPDGPTDLSGALAAYSELLAREAAAELAVDALQAAIAPLQKEGALPEMSAAELVAGSLHRAVAARLWSKDADAAVKSARRDGFFLAGAFLQALAAPAAPAEAAADEAGSVSSRADVLGPVLAAAEVRRLTAEFAKERAGR